MIPIYTPRAYADHLAAQGLIDPDLAIKALPDYIAASKWLDGQGHFMLNAMASIDPNPIEDVEQHMTANLALPSTYQTNDEQGQTIAQQAVSTARTHMLSYGVNADAVSKADAELLFGLTEDVCDAYRLAVLKKAVLSVRLQSKTHMNLLCDAKNKVRDEGLAPSAFSFSWTRDEDADILSRIPIGAPVNEDTLKRAVRDYVPKYNNRNRRH